MNFLTGCCNYCIRKLKSLLSYRVDYFENFNYYKCSDSPYEFISFQLLAEIRNLIELQHNPVDKRYLRFLEEYIYILDHLCDDDCREMIEFYGNNLNKAMKLEKKIVYKELLINTFNALKLGLKRIDNKEDMKYLENQINKFQDIIFKNRTDNNEHELSLNYLKILYKLPKLALVRRGFRMSSTSFTFLNQN